MLSTATEQKISLVETASDRLAEAEQAVEDNHLNEGKRLYTQAIQLLEQAYQEVPRPGTKRTLANTCFKIGELLEQLHALQEARKHYERALALGHTQAQKRIDALSHSTPPIAITVTSPLFYPSAETKQSSSSLSPDDDLEAILAADEAKREIRLDDNVETIRERVLDALPRQELTLKLKSAEERMRKEADSNPELKLYIAARGMVSAGTGEHTFDLDERINQFFESKDRSVFLLLGNAGAGKSTYGRYLAKRLAKQLTSTDASTEQKAPISLFINLPNLQDPEHRLMEEHLTTQLGLNDVEIAHLKKHYTLWVILDGYDEINKRGNLYQTNHLETWNAKWVITCRSQYIAHLSRYHTYFAPIERGQPALTRLEEAAVAPFKQDQINHYVDQYLSMHREEIQAQGLGAEWLEATTYHTHIEHIPGLQALITTPFLLRIAMEALPHIIKQHPIEQKSTDSKEIKTSEGLTRIAMQMTQARLYDEFFKQWFKRQGDKVLPQDLPEDGHNIEEDYWAFSEQLASAMHQAGITQIDYKPISRLNPRKANEWDRFFTNDDKEMVTIRKGCPLMLAGPNRYVFLHASLIEYFATKSLYEKMKAQSEEEAQKKERDEKVVEQKTAQPKKALAPLESKAIPPVALSEIEMLSERLLNGENNLLQFLADRVNQDPNFKAQLFGFIEASKQDRRYVIASANAATILNKANVNFSELNWEGVCIAGADLSGGVLDSMNLRGADLTNVRLQGAWFRQNDLTGATMKDIQFGEYPGLTLNSSIHACAYSPDGRLFAIGCKDSNIYLYDTRTWLLQGTLKGHMSIVSSVAFSPSGREVVSGSNDETFRLWDVATGACLRKMKRPQYGVSSIAFSSSGREVLSGSDDKTCLRLWDMCLPGMEGARDSVWSVAFSPSGHEVVSGSWDHTLRLWNVATGECLREMEGHTDSVWSVAFSPSGREVVSGSCDNMLRLWNVATGECLREMEGHTDKVWSVAFSPSGEEVVSGSEDHTLHLWDVETGECLREMKGHTNGVTRVAFSPSGREVVSGSKDHTLRLWDIETGTCLREMKGHTSGVSSIAFNPSGREVVSGSEDKTLRIWNVATSECLRQMKRHTSGISSIAFNPSGREVVSGSSDKTLRLWDVATGECLREMKGHMRDVLSVAFSPSGREVVSGSEDKTLRIWNVTTGECLREMKGHTSDVNSVAFSPSGREVASGSGNMFGRGDNSIRLWDVETGTCLREMKGHTREVSSVAFSLSGREVMSGSDDATLRLWDVETGECLREMKRHRGGIKSVAFSPSGCEVVSGSWDQTLRLWDVATGECLREINMKGVLSVAFSPSGAYVASGSWDQIVRIWNAKTGECCAVVKGFPNRVSALQWHRTALGDDYLVTGCVDNGVRLFKLITQGQGQHQIFRAVLCWTSQTGTLVATDTCLNNAIGLSANNGDLLKQRGAVGEFKVVEEKDQKDGKETQRASASHSTDQLTSVAPTQVFFRSASPPTQSDKSAEKKCFVM